ncbi:MAG: NAD(P)-binding protein [Pseudomonadota bacterium]
MRVAIIGAGVCAGAASARLRQAGIEAQVFEKSRGPGGRTATRRTTVDGRKVGFDHGCTVATADGVAFKAFLDEAVEAGAAAPWPEGLGVVGVPGMNALARRLLADTQIHPGFPVASLNRQGDGWHLTANDGRSAGPFAAVLSTVPAVQAVPLLASAAPMLSDAAATATYNPAWAGLFAFPDAESHRLADLEATALQAEGVERLIDNGGKPHRVGATLVLHADPVWSAKNLEWEAQTVRDHFVKLLSGLSLPEPMYASAHRWRYSTPAKTAVMDTPFDPSLMVGAAGDWAGPTGAIPLENAYLAGTALADAAASALTGERPSV